MTNRRATRSRFGARFACVGLAACGLALAPGQIIAPCPGCVDTLVEVTLPQVVFFDVTDVGAMSTGSPDPTVASFVADSNGTSIRFSVQADNDFVPVSGPAMPADLVSWITAGTSNGVGFSGTLTANQAAIVYESDQNSQKGSVDIVWMLAPPANAMTALPRAGNHELTMRWIIESIQP